MGVRRARLDASARGLYQRHRDRREGPPLPLARARPPARRCPGPEREPVLIFGLPKHSVVVPAKAGTHNQTPWIGEGRIRVALPIDFAVWVPAFAGTTWRGGGLRRRLVARDLGLVELELFGDRLCNRRTPAQALVIGFYGRPFC